MLNQIIKQSLHNRLLVSVCAVLLLLGGYYTAKDMDVDVFPDLTAPTVTVMTEATGMAPEEVEKLVSFPIETAVNGATGIRRVRSSSAEGFSIVWVEFDWEMDVYKARQIVSEKLQTIADQLPETVGQPTLAPQSSIMGEIMVVALSSDSVAIRQLRTMADWEVRPRLLAVNGVAQVTVYSSDQKQYSITANPLRMQHYQVSLGELRAAAENISNNAAGGFIEENGSRYMVRALARTNQLSEIENTVIKQINGNAVRVGDVAKVQIESKPYIGSGSVDAKQGVVMLISKQPNVNTLDLTKDVEKEIDNIKATLSNNIRFHSDIFKQANFISTAINNVAIALRDGAILVVVVLFLFLMNIRTTFISLIALPLSLLLAIIALQISGLGINTMSLGGMAIAVGSLVDDAIIDVENVYKRLRQNAALPEAERRNSLTVIYEASVEIRSSIVNATLIIIAAFVPLFFLVGMEGRMLRPLGLTYIISLFSSLVVAMTLTPVMSYFLLTKQKALEKGADGSYLERKLSVWYRSALEKVLQYKKLVLSFAIALFAISVVVLSGFGRSFLPPFNEGALTINVSTMPGIAYQEAQVMAREAEKVVLSMPEIQTAAMRLGRAELAEHSLGLNVAEIDAPYTLGERHKSEFMAELREKLLAIPGVTIELGQPITHRINHMLSGSKASIAVKVFGNDLRKLYRTAKSIEAEMQQVEGIVDLNVEQQIEIPQIKIEPKRDILASYNMPVGQLLEFVNTAIGGETIGDIFEGQTTFDLVLRYGVTDRNNLDALRSVLVDTPNGKKVPLANLANVRISSGPNTIGRENVRRRIIVSANTEGRDILSVVTDVRERVNENVNMPSGYTVAYGGQFESEAKASEVLLFASSLSLLIIFLLLYQEFKDLSTTGIILLNLPLSLIGGVWAILVSSGELNIPAIIGFITLFGIATRNGILLVSRIKALVEAGMQPNLAIINGAADRLIPILMTALTAALALVPLALAGDQPGNEIQSPLAIVILGGLLSSTILNVFVIPIVYWYRLCGSGSK